MTITSASHKALLTSLFYVGVNERTFPIDTVHVAARCLAKLKDGSTVTVADSQTTIHLADGDTVFDNEETAMLRDLLNGLTEAKPSEFQLIGELNALLQSNT